MTWIAVRSCPAWVETDQFIQHSLLFFQSIMAVAGYGFRIGVALLFFHRIMAVVGYGFMIGMASQLWGLQWVEIITQLLDDCCDHSNLWFCRPGRKWMQHSSFALPMYFYQLELFCTRHWILDCQLDSARNFQECYHPSDNGQHTW